MKVEQFEFNGNPTVNSVSTSEPILDAIEPLGKDECIVEILILTGTATVDIVGRVTQGGTYFPLVSGITSSGLYAVTRVPEMAIDVTATTGILSAKKAT